jgi:hypothetical protein
MTSKFALTQWFCVHKLTFYYNMLLKMFTNLKRVLNYLAELHSRKKLFNMFSLLKNKFELFALRKSCYLKIKQTQILYYLSLLNEHFNKFFLNFVFRKKIFPFKTRHHLLGNTTWNGDTR